MQNGKIRILSLALMLIMGFVELRAQNTKRMEKKTSGYAPANGIKMYYETYGTGKIPLVLIHGGGSTIETSFSNLLPVLPASMYVIAVELQAHGRTSDREGPESFEQDADDVAALLKYLKISKANMLGFSNGGTTTLQIAARHPELVNKIIAISSAISRDGFISGFFDGMQHANIDNMPGPLKTAYTEVAADKSNLIVMFEKDKQRMINFKDIPDETIKSIKAPALIMVADQDVVTTEHNLKISKMIAGAQFVVLPGVHGEFLGEICTAKKGSKLPSVTAMLVEEFLKQ